MQARNADDKNHHYESKVSHGADLSEKHGSGETALPSELISAGSQHLHRRLGGKEIQLFAVGGAIGTCMSGLCGFVKYTSPFRNSVC
jgi:amino acid transporter